MKRHSFSNMPVKKKVTVFSITILFWMILIAIVGLFTANRVSKAKENRYNNYAMGRFYLSEAFTNFCNIKVHVRNIIFVYYDDATKLQEQEQLIAEYKDGMRKNLDAFEERMGAFKSETVAQYQVVEDTLDKCYASMDADIEMVDNKQVEAAAQDLLENGRIISDEAQAALNKLGELLEAESDASNKKVESEMVLLTVLLVIVGLIAIFVTMTYCAALIKGITVPVAKLSVAARQMAIGDVDVDCEKVSDDDLGELLDNFKNMAEATKSQVDVAEKISNGDLSVEAHQRSDKDVLGQALAKLVADNNATLGNIKEAGSQITVGAEQVASASQALAQGSTEQASAIEQVTASIDEVTQRTKDNATEAGEANKLMTNVKNMATTENGQMKSMISAMNDINASSETISKIIKTIDDIAFQTNILALNAAVEAARAGVHGKGFAVVAEEVRNLAAKSASAASETAEMIEDSIQKVRNGMRLAEETAQALDEIVVSIDEVATLIAHITISSNEQATSISQIDQAISQVSSVVQTNAATSEQCAAASEELSNQAVNLRNLMSKYRLKAGMSGGFSSDRESVSSSMSSSNYNEQIISLDGEFGKY
ncbi:MAG: methyl-accepting chemotaxis protein [Lachnospiraceae bacterium]|nr:methyl-accepting chemotaxis protein [Lachnospiraceae bacterium]